MERHRHHRNPELLVQIWDLTVGIWAIMHAAGDIMDTSATKILCANSHTFLFFHTDKLLYLLFALFLCYLLLQFFFLIIPSYFSAILVVYLLGEVDVFTPILHIFSFVLYPPFVSLTFPRT